MYDETANVDFQEWTIRADGSVESGPACPGMVITIQSCDNGVAVIISARSEGSANQEWFFRDTGAIEVRSARGRSSKSRPEQREPTTMVEWFRFGISLVM